MVIPLERVALATLSRLQKTTRKNTVDIFLRVLSIIAFVGIAHERDLNRSQEQVSLFCFSENNGQKPADIHGLWTLDWDQPDLWNSLLLHLSLEGPTIVEMEPRCNDGDSADVCERLGIRRNRHKLLLIVFLSIF